jgi:hypothetical protein
MDPTCEAQRNAQQNCSLTSCFEPSAIATLSPGTVVSGDAELGCEEDTWKVIDPYGSFAAVGDAMGATPMGCRPSRNDDRYCGTREGTVLFD